MVHWSEASGEECSVYGLEVQTPTGLSIRALMRLPICI